MIPTIPGLRERAGILTAAVAISVLLLVWVCHAPFLPVYLAGGLLWSIVAVFTLAAWRRGLRWFCSRGALRFYGWFVLGLASVILLFYAEESWRGKRAWNALQQETAARGEALALASVLPAAVPEDQNFALAPGVPALLGYSGAEASAGTPVATKAFAHGNEAVWPKGSWVFQEPTDLKQWQQFVRRHAPEPTNASGALAPASRPPATEAELAERRERLVRDQLRHEFKKLDTVPGLTFPVAPEPQAPAADVLLALSQYEADLAVLREASRRPACRYPLDASRGYFALHEQNALPVEALSRATHLLVLRASAELVQGQEGEALADIELGLRLAETLAEEPLALAQIYRCKLVLWCLQPVWEGLGTHRWTEPQLARLQQRLAAIDMTAGYQRAVRGETLSLMDLIDQLQAYLEHRPSSAGEAGLGDGAADRFWTAVARLVYPSGWFYQNKVWLYRQLQKRPAPLQAVGLAPLELKAAWGLDRMLDPLMLVFFVPRVLETFNECGRQALFAGSALAEARTACALERFRLAHRQYPVALAGLTPDFLERIPIDPAARAGGTLKYQLQDPDRFVLYSIGLNQVDDGAKTALVREDHWHGLWHGALPFLHLDQGDWVWSYRR